MLHRSHTIDGLLQSVAHIYYKRKKRFRWLYWRNTVLCTFTFSPATTVLETEGGDEDRCSGDYDWKRKNGWCLDFIVQVQGLYTGWGFIALHCPGLGWSNGIDWIAWVLIYRLLIPNA